MKTKETAKVVRPMLTDVLFSLGDAAKGRGLTLEEINKTLYEFSKNEKAPAAVKKIIWEFREGKPYSYDVEQTAKFIHTNKLNTTFF